MGPAWLSAFLETRGQGEVRLQVHFVGKIQVLKPIRLRSLHGAYVLETFLSS